MNNATHDGADDATRSAIVRKLNDDFRMTLTGGAVLMTAGVVALGYGQFVTVAINTLILAFAVFLVVRAVNNMKARMAKEEQEKPPAAPPTPAPDVVLLTEIRDLLKKG